ncbi:MAG: hypothetical protein JWL67_2142 [Solirubrobacterales bacterium]|nr:hypothetical protein [Solirubrobacterales bacterium]
MCTACGDASPGGEVERLSSHADYLGLSYRRKHLWPKPNYAECPTGALPRNNPCNQIN